MLPPQDNGADTTGQDHELHVRIRAEFAEMPGLRLTLPQAARLFNLQRTHCERVLAVLVDQRVLSANGTTFARAGSV